MAMVGQTVTIVNKSGKVVKSSKHIVNVFKEAKSAYAERKAEIKATRRREDEERLARIKLRDLDLDEDDARSRRSSTRNSEDGTSSPKRTKTKSRRSHERPPLERGLSDSFYATERPSPKRRDSHRPSPLRDEVAATRVGELTRRHTENFDVAERRRNRPSTPRSASMDDIDMDLAYGDLPPPMPESKYENEVELRQKMTSLQRLLDECNCIQHSVTATIDNLQKNPDALAAVALTLAEISNIAAKMAPGALTALKGSFPAVVALLASPQFMIAAGVGVGVTIIALGGYKIIKKVKAKKEEQAMLLENGEPNSPVSEADELREISGIERWRRGIADVEAESLSTSVDGEFLTPHATRTLIEEGRLTEADLKSLDGSEGKKKKKSKKEKEGKEKKSKKGGSEVSSSTSRGKKEKKEKEPSGLKMLFKGRSTVGKPEPQFV